MTKEEEEYGAEGRRSERKIELATQEDVSNTEGLIVDKSVN